MAASEPTPEPRQPTPKELGESLAAQIGDQEWVLDEIPAPGTGNPGIVDATPEGELNLADLKLPNPSPQISDQIPLAEAAVEPEIPPAPLQIIEAMLFIGGQPLKAERACQIVKGLGEDEFRASIEVLNRVYRMQNRPYFVAVSEAGYTLTVRPRYRSIKEKLFGGPREARLTQPALDVLALVAYRQPAAKAEIDSVRGNESGPILRQLTRLGLISVVQRAEAKQREVSYGTTDRFLELFNLQSLEDLPQTGDVQRL